MADNSKPKNRRPNLQALYPRDQQVANGAAWRKPREQGVEIWLPYGQQVVRIRTVRPDHLLAQGDIPDILSPLMLDMIYGRANEKKTEAILLPKESVEEAMQLLETLRVVCTAALVEPRIVSEPLAEDEITIDELEYEDRRYIFRLVFLPTEVLSTFRYQAQVDVEPLPHSAGVLQPSE